MKLVGRAMALLLVAGALLIGLAVVRPMMAAPSDGVNPGFEGAVTGDGSGAPVGPMSAEVSISGGDGEFLDAPASAIPMTITYLVDGDTLSAADANGTELRIRLIGIDTPETYPETECYGPEAAAELARIAPLGATVLVSEDVETEDRYGRALRYLWDADGLIELRLVQGGFAEAIKVGANDAHWPELSAAEDAARDAGLGMWGAC